MRIVHSADWHVGRLWKNISRLDETSRVLDSLAEFLEREKIDLLLVAGDIFDTNNPGADAEQLVFEFFRRLGAKNIPAVVIAGNHDSPGRIDAYGTLADLAGVHLVGRPRLAARGGVLTLPTASGEKAIVASLPFAAPGVFVTALELGGDASNARAHYAEKFQLAAAHLAQSFRPDCVNLLMAHSHVEGALIGNSERQVHLGAEWTARPQTLPDKAQYVALGHIHRPQRMDKAPIPTEYSGSILQLDFGEAGQAKSFVVVDVQPGGEAKIERVPYQGGKELLDLKLTLPELEARQEEFQAAGWLRVSVVNDAPMPDLARKVRQQLGNALVIRFEPSAAEAERRLTVESPTRAQSGKRPVEMYREFHERQYQRLPDPAVEEAFQRLYEKCED
jgi:DNA repair protein SbcD/Mre11